MNIEFVEKQIEHYAAKFDKLLPKFKQVEAQYNELSCKLAYLKIAQANDQELLKHLKQREFEANEARRVAAEQAAAAAAPAPVAAEGPAPVAEAQPKVEEPKIVEIKEEPAPTPAPQELVAQPQQSLIIEENHE